MFRMSSVDSSAARRAYDAWHMGAESGDATADTPWHELLYRHLEPSRDLEGRTVLEIGCGRGELARRLTEQPHAPARYIGADFADTAVRFARRRTADPTAAAWALADMQRIGLRSASFDTVISCETIEHLPDPAAALREVARVLKPGGRLFLTTPNYFGLTGAYRIYLRASGRRYTEGGQPICRFTALPRTAWWIRRAGLRIQACDADGHYSLWPGRVPLRREYPEWVRRALWPVGLHSIFVAEKR
jgi:2-polyprenyl-3-methyl-5-hydroxy-6-metoxy-1,4-benzoquinol methylase